MSWDDDEDEIDLSTEAVLSDDRGGVALSVEGRYIGTFKDDTFGGRQKFGDRAPQSADQKARKAFRDWCEKHGYYPNLYWISDHGNVHGPISPHTGREYKRGR